MDSLILKEISILFIGIIEREFTKENEKKYGKMMGIGMMIMGTGITITTLLQIIFDSESLWLITVISIIVGLLFMIYGQFKYNKGIF